ncbi:MAG: glycosyltransferase family 39 protein [Patescibacteria group bacterium]|nr:glycosyltransferase family 39 protein [Patescibacteria group bacterium]
MKTISLIVIFSLAPTFLLWLPFFLRIENVFGIPLPKDGMATVVANYDGPLYIVVSKTFYDPQAVGEFPFTLPSEYYAAHFPLFPLLIKIFSSFTNSIYAMLIATILFSIIGIYYFYLLAKDIVGEKKALWLAFVFSIFPARWLIVRSVGAAEPMFLAAITASLYYFRRENYWMAGIWGALAQLTKSPGILLFIGFCISIIIAHFRKTAFASILEAFSLKSLIRTIPLLLIPIALVGVFCLYYFRMGNFFAYFNSGDNIHLFFPPFQVFNYSQAWVGTFWLEEIIFLYLLGLLGFFKLVSMKEEKLYCFYAVFLISLFFVAHRDILRYGLPIAPLALIAFHETLTKKEFKIIFGILLLPIYLYALTYISQNTMPITNWSKLI